MLIPQQVQASIVNLLVLICHVISSNILHTPKKLNDLNLDHT